MDRRWGRPRRRRHRPTLYQRKATDLLPSTRDREPGLFPRWLAACPQRVPRSPRALDPRLATEKSIDRNESTHRIGSVLTRQPMDRCGRRRTRRHGRTATLEQCEQATAPKHPARWRYPVRSLMDPRFGHARPRDGRQLDPCAGPRRQSKTLPTDPRRLATLDGLYRRWQTLALGCP